MSILDKAKEIIYEDREQTYGDPARNLRKIGELWTTYLDLPIGAINPEDVANMMILLKVARLKNTPGHPDSLTDVAGYAALIDRIHNAPENSEPTRPVRTSDLVERVRGIDPKAAEWILDNVPQGDIHDPERGKYLSRLFTWRSTPQGHPYWLNIFQEL